ncbi:hypothetical protein NESM_000911800 [Novymonas esmeraldas]|uniref:Uncharacterized protein n=1 Tax=Novymonas esmeraldas TaxID=1808958 RepID=A0AAW0F2S8_9TRYP
MTDCEAAEGAERAATVAEERAARDALALAAVADEEAVARHLLEGAETSSTADVREAALHSRGVAVGQLRSRVQQAMTDCEAAEGAERAATVAEERAAHDTLALAAVADEETVARHVLQVAETAAAVEAVQEETRGRGLLVRRLQSRVSKALVRCQEREEEARRSVDAREAASRGTIVAEAKTRAAVVAAVATRKNTLQQDEGLARTGVELDEKGDRELLRGERELTLAELAAREAAAAAAAAPVRDAAPPSQRLPAAVTQSPEAATALLQRVGRGALLRRRLQRRMQNRRRDALKHGVGRILADEFSGRRAIVGEEYLQRHGVADQYDRAVPMEPCDDPGDAVLQQLAAEEEAARAEVLGDYVTASDAITRAEHKEFLKRGSAFWMPTAPDSSSDEEDVAALLLAGLPRIGESTLTAASRKNSSRTRYKGFELDALGRFLLDYQKDLNRMQTSLTDYRRSVALDHDQLKDVRDRAAQEVVRGGTGAMWVPARPLPLSDLVRGPSTQYEGKRVHRPG